VLVHGDGLDLLLLVLVVGSAVSGYRQGFVVGVLSFVGLVGGGVLGATLAPHIAQHFAGRTEAVIGVVVVFAFASIGMAVATAVGGLVRGQLRWRPAQFLDSAGGAVTSAIAVLLVAWFIGSSLAQSPFPSVAREVNGSKVLTDVDGTVPSQVQDFFADFRKVVITRGFPQVFGALGAERIVPVAAPDPAVTAAAGIVAASASIVKIVGDAASCSRQIEGSGFFFAPGKVMTNAHVVAGVQHPRVSVGGVGTTVTATVVLYDAKTDIAVLSVPGLSAPALSFASLGAEADAGADAVVAGFPENGPYTLSPARIRGVENARGPDIYQDAQVTRQIYAVRSQVEPGNSGGPLLSTAGQVDGVVFAKAIDDDSTGYALTAKQVAADATLGATASTQVSTQGCD
jgi:S1-C subfamily serine protease